MENSYVVDIKTFKFEILQPTKLYFVAQFAAFLNLLRLSLSGSYFGVKLITEIEVGRVHKM